MPVFVGIIVLLVLHLGQRRGGAGSLKRIGRVIILVLNSVPVGPGRTSNFDPLIRVGDRLVLAAVWVGGSRRIG